METLNLHRSQVNMSQHVFDLTQDRHLYDMSALSQKRPRREL